MPVTANTFCKLSANTGFFPASTNIGLVKSGNFLYLIDTGSSLAVAQEVLTALSTLFPDCKVKAILNTHSHSDHCGGNDYIVSQTKAEVWASYENSLIMQYTSLLETEGVKLDITEDALDRMSTVAEEVNASAENIGARRLHTIMEKVLADINFEADEHKGETIKIDAAYVDEKLEGISQNQDLSRYIL